TLRSLMHDRTTILIAHRRSTLRLAHRIVVLEAGRVVAEGSHEELLVRSATYRDLFAGPGEDLDGEGTPTAVVGLAPPAEDEDAAVGDATAAGTTAAAWPDMTILERSAPVATPTAATAGAPGGRGGGGGGGGGGGPFGGMAL